MKGIIFFKRYFANAVILLTVGVLAIVGFQGKSVPTAAVDSPVYKGSSKTKVSLMFNVYWGNEYIEGILDTLEKHGAKTTFFVGGSWVRDNEELFLKIVDAGHEIGNHGFFHKDHDKLTYDAGVQEIQATHSLVKAVCGIEMSLFAPPSGAFSKSTLDSAADNGYITVMWSKDTIDWRDKDSAKIYKRATKNITGGDLVLMHPTAATAAALDAVLCTIKENGLSVAPVSEVICSDE